jgi:hypothetical protein
MSKISIASKIGNPTPKLLCLVGVDYIPDAIDDKQKLQTFGDDYRLCNVRNCEDWNESDLTDCTESHKVFDSTTTEDEDTGETVVTETFNADDTIAALFTAMAAVEDDDYTGGGWFIAFTIAEVKALKATDAYIAAFSTDDDDV